MDRRRCKLMKNILLILLLLLPACTESDAWMSPVMVGSSVPPAGDGWIGWGSEDAVDWTISAPRQYWTPYTTTTSGNVRYAHIWVVDGNGMTTCLSLHSTDGTKLLSGSAALSDDTEGWEVIDMGGTYPLVAATSYLLAIQRDGSDIVIGRNTGGPDLIYVDYDDYGCGQVIGEGTAPVGDTESDTRSITIVFDNTATAAPSTP